MAEQPVGQTPKDREAGRFLSGHALAKVAIDFHQSECGDSGCAGIECPAVQRLIYFGEVCVATWNVAYPSADTSAVPHG